MADHLSLSTGDPRFDPRKPVKVNGYLFLPAEPQRARVSVPVSRLPRDVMMHG